jgi:AAA ATPase domain
MTAPERTLHGRDAALGAVRAALDGALGGRGQVVVVSGEAGIGKSALAAVIAREAAARGAEVTWGRAWEFADAPPYFPVWPCLRALGLDPLGAHQEPHDAAYAFRLWEGVAEALSRATARKPVLWLLEDLHAADLGTLDLLAFLAHAVRGVAALVIGTVRTRDPRLVERAEQRLTRLAREGLEVRLGPLADLDVGALVEDALGQAVPANVLRRLVELTGGNPLFVTECARTLRESNAGALGSLPPTVRQVVLERVGLLPEATQRTLAAGAVVGREFSAAVAAHMAEALPARVIDTLLPALRAGVVSESKPGTFVFSHALVRDAIEEGLERAARARLHGRAEAALATRGDGVDVLVERARHALSALPFGDATDALALARRATSLLESDGAFDRAFELHARVDELESSGLLPSRTPDELLGAAKAAEAAGRSDASRSLCERVLALARRTGDGALFGRAALLHARDVLPGVVDRAQVALFEEARRLLADGEPTLRCRVLARLATALQPAANAAEPMRLTREALDIARGTGDGAAVLDVLDLARWGLYQAPLAERVALASELSTRALEANDLPRAVTACGFLAEHALEANDYAGYAAEVERMLGFSAEVGHPRHRWRALLYASGRAANHGHFAEAERYVAEVRALSALTDDRALPMALTLHEAFRARIERRDDDLTGCIEKLEPVFALAWQAELLTALFAAACRAFAGDVTATRQHLDSIGTRAGVFDSSPELLALLGEVVALAGGDAERRRVRSLLARSERLELIGFVSCIYAGSVLRVLGLLDAALGDLESAEKQLSQALIRARSHGQRAWVAQLSFELGGVLERQGREHESRTLLAECAALARELGMPGLERRLNAGVAAERPPASALELELELVGEIWNVARGPHRASVKDSRGMRLLARLVERPGQEIHVLALASDLGASAAESDAGEVLDERAIVAYRKRLSALDARLAEAVEHADEGRRARLTEEREALEVELRRAVGLGGRARRAGSATERARVTVQKRVKEAVGRIGEASPELGRFFESSLSTGTFCIFRH